jgi:GNAT superfamily N-acetyltransferase
MSNDPMSTRAVADVRYVECGAADAAALTAHLLGLAPQDRSLRFGIALSDGAIATYVAHAIGRLPAGTDQLTGAVDGRQRIVGFLHLYLDGGRAEAALSVDAALRRCGIGMVLLWRAITLAHAAGARVLLLCGLDDHMPITALARRAGLSLRDAGPAGSCGVLELAPVAAA